MKTKRMLLCVVIGAALLIGGSAGVDANFQKMPAAAGKTSSLSPAILQNTISTTGVVESYTMDIVSWIICPSKITATLYCLEDTINKTAWPRLSSLSGFPF